MSPISSPNLLFIHSVISQKICARTVNFQENTIFIYVQFMKGKQKVLLSSLILLFKGFHIPFSLLHRCYLWA